MSSCVFGFLGEINFALLQANAAIKSIKAHFFHDVKIIIQSHEVQADFIRAVFLTINFNR